MKFIKCFPVHTQLIEILQQKSSNPHQTSFSAEDQTGNKNCDRALMFLTGTASGNMVNEHIIGIDFCISSLEKDQHIKQ